MQKERQQYLKKEFFKRQPLKLRLLYRFGIYQIRIKDGVEPHTYFVEERTFNPINPLSYILTLIIIMAGIIHTVVEAAPDIKSSFKYNKL